jgi:hypothetical protein
VKKLAGGTGKEVMTIRVYLISELAGVKPVKAFEYQIAAGEKPESVATKMFNVDGSTVAKLAGG